MSKVSDATKVDGTEGTWVKVSEEGYDASTKKWADVSVLKNVWQLATNPLPGYLECQLREERVHRPG